MKILFTIDVSIFISYIIFILVYIGIKNLSSLSDSFYKLEEKKKGLEKLFQIVMAIVPMGLISLILEVTPSNFQIFAFLTTMPIIFVALAPRYEIGEGGQDLERNVHTVAAIISGVSSFIWVILISIHINWVLILTIPVASLVCFILYIIYKQGLFMIEMASFMWTLTTLGFLIFKIKL